MPFGDYRVRTSPAAFVWAGAILLFALVSLGVVDNQSARHARARLALQPRRPVVVVDLAGNREARGDRRQAEIEAWREAGASLDRSVELFDGTSLAELDPGRFAVWILPGQERLSDADWVALDAYLAGNGGLILTGAVGRYSETGTRPTRSVLERLFPGERFARPEAASRQLQVVGRSPLVAGLVPGAELVLAEPARVLAAASPGALEFRGTRSGSGALFGRHRSARIAWLGFSIGQLTDGDVAQRVAGNALRFASRAPSLDLRPWPDGRPCAVLVGASTGTDLPTDPCRVDTNEIPTGGLEELISGGCRFATTAAGARALPDILAHAGAPFVSIPEPRPHGDAEGSALLRELLSGYERAERMGSVFSLRARIHRPEAKGREALLESLGQELALRGAWFARPDELADWWLARDQVGARIEPLASDRVRVVFENRGAVTARGVTARVYIPGGAVAPRIETRRLFARRALLRLASDHSWIELVARPLDPGTEVSYIIRF